MDFFLYGILVYSLTNHILKCYVDLMVKLLTIHPL